MAPLMAMEPSLVAGTLARLPLNEPIGVRTALTITTSWAQQFRKERKIRKLGCRVQTLELTTMPTTFISSKLLTLSDGRVV